MLYAPGICRLLGSVTGGIGMFVLGCVHLEAKAIHKELGQLKSELQEIRSQVAYLSGLQDCLRNMIGEILNG